MRPMLWRLTAIVLLIGAGLLVYGFSDHRDPTLEEVATNLAETQAEMEAVYNSMGQLRSSLYYLGKLPPEARREAILQANHHPEISLALLLATISLESNFDPNAVSSRDARGLGQIRLVTAQEAAKQLGLGPITKEDLHDPVLNIKLTAHILAQLIREADGDLHKALTAYNRGREGASQFEQRYGTSISAYSREVLRRTGISP